MITKKILVVLLTVTFVFLSSCVTFGGALTGKKIMVDPGHGGWDPGAVGPTGLKEKDVNLRVGKALQGIMQAYGGATVYMTRTNDYYVSLSGRADMANAKNADRYISVHHNASDVNSKADWTETYYYTYASSTSKNLAQKVQNRLVTATGLPNGGAKPANFAVLRQTKMPAILTEASFISNRYEEARLRDSNYTWREAYYIYQGVVDHYQK